MSWCDTWADYGLGARTDGCIGGLGVRMDGDALPQSGTQPEQTEQETALECST